MGGVLMGLLEITPKMMMVTVQIFVQCVMSQVIVGPAVLSGGIEEVEHQEGQGKYSQLIMSV